MDSGPQPWSFKALARVPYFGGFWFGAHGATAAPNCAIAPLTYFYVINFVGKMGLLE